MSVGDRQHALAVGDVVDRAGDRGHAAERPRSLARQLRPGGRADGLDASDLRLVPGQGRDLRRVAANDGDVEVVEQFRAVSVR